MKRVSGVRNTAIPFVLLMLISIVGCGVDDLEAPPPAALVSIIVTPDTVTLVPESFVQLTAFGIYTDGRKRDLTSFVTWTSSDTGIATVSNMPGSKGRTTATFKIGFTIIKATLDNISGTAEVATAIPQSIAVEPVDPVIAPETMIQFTATATFWDRSEQNVTNHVIWDSSDQEVAEISPAGLATSKTEGATTITAMFPGIAPDIVQDETTLTSAMPDSIEVTPENPSVIAGTNQQFKATATFTGTSSNQDLTRSVTWTSSDTSVAKIDMAGKATTTAAGVTTITAIFFTASAGERAGQTDLVVTESSLVSIEVTPVDPDIPLGKTLQFKATGTYSNNFEEDITTTVTWSSSGDEIATISNADGSEGLAASIAVGTTVIRATQGKISDSTTLTITPAEIESILVTPVNVIVSIGSQLSFSATGIKTDESTIPLTSSVDWNSSNPTVAAISITGLAQTFSIGTTIITATYVTASGTFEDSTTLEVVFNTP